MPGRGRWSSTKSLCRKFPKRPCTGRNHRTQAKDGTNVGIDTPCRRLACTTRPDNRDTNRRIRGTVRPTSSPFPRTSFPAEFFGAEAARANDSGANPHRRETPVRYAPALCRTAPTRRRCHGQRADTPSFYYIVDISGKVR